MFKSQNPFRYFLQRNGKEYSKQTVIAAGQVLWALRSVCVLLYLCLCFENLTHRDKFKTSDVYKGDFLYTSNLVSEPKIERFGRLQTLCSGKESSMPSSTRVINTCRVLIKASMSLLLIRLTGGD